ncbi:hypothetical protein MJM99_33465, partial [Salmonella enterica subsp. enterica serovar Kentucky]|nr:hypothetical protein [Salmonella enterica subsp. enterica serovar Kentucky]
HELMQSRYPGGVVFTTAASDMETVAEAVRSGAFDYLVKPIAYVKRIEFVGPSVGADLAQTGAMALLVALISILVYVGFSFEWRL